MARKLTDRLGLTSEQAAPRVEPELTLPETDKARNLAAAAESGFAAVQKLYADHTSAVEKAQSLHRHNVYLLNVNATLRDEAQRARQERDHYLQAYTRIGAWAAQVHDLVSRIVQELGITENMLQQLPSPPMVTNNPTVPPLDASGLPKEKEPELPVADYGFGFDAELPPPVSHEDVRAIAAKFANGGTTA